MSDQTKGIDIGTVLLPILGLLLGAISAPLRGLLSKLLKDLYTGAKATDSPVDDIFVKFISALLGVPCE